MIYRDTRMRGSLWTTVGLHFIGFLTCFQCVKLELQVIRPTYPDSQIFFCVSVDSGHCSQVGMNIYYYRNQCALLYTYQHWISSAMQVPNFPACSHLPVTLDNLIHYCRFQTALCRQQTSIYSGWFIDVYSQVVCNHLYYVTKQCGLRSVNICLNTRSSKMTVKFYFKCSQSAPTMTSRDGTTGSTSKLAVIYRLETDRISATATVSAPKL